MTTDHGSVRLTPADDAFHRAVMSDRWWETETAWFSFNVPERRLGGWLYVMVRPNIGTVAGGAWVWDDRAWLPWEVLYSANYSALRLPADADLTDITLPTGVRIRVLEPLTRYELGYRDEGRFVADLRFDAVMPPVSLIRSDSAFGALGHFDQIGRVTGRIEVLGEPIEVDCLALRDRSWGPRPEHRPRRSAYVTGVAAATSGFLAVTAPAGAASGQAVNHGFLLRDGIIGRLVAGHRNVRHDPVHGWITDITLQATDEHGRVLMAHGQPLSRIVVNRHTFIDVNTLLAWSIGDGSANGAEQGTGEDQDMWPVPQWADHRREQNTGNA